MFSFTIDLPIVESSVKKPNPGPDLNDTKVLVVDDQKICRTVMIDHFRSIGADPVGVSNAADAIKLLEQARHSDLPIPIVIADYNMPEQNGLSIAAYLRCSSPEYCHRMILTSSVQDHAIEQQCQTLGIGAYLPKPVRKTTMGNALKVAMAAPDGGENVQAATG